MSFGWAETAATGVEALSAARAGDAVMETPVMAMVPAMANALIFFIKIMSKLLCSEMASRTARVVRLGGAGLFGRPVNVCTSGIGQMVAEQM
ncbi:hypothetical protein HMPREF3223_00081 [Cutibacterium avidum]|nr:hypothetical protein HMPREF3223_00081 [Cutibacterium avidum]